MTRKNNHLTDTQIQELKEQMLKLHMKIEKTIALLDAQDPFKDPDHSVDNAAIDTDIREQMGHDTAEAKIDALQKRRDLIERAISKIDKGTYGLDEKSGEPIPYDRLKIVPETQYTVETEKKLVK